MEPVRAKDEDVTQYIGRKLKVNRGDEEFIGILSEGVDMKNQRRWVLEAENDSMHFLPSEGWLIYLMDS
jgi:hypothetical protein